MTRSEHEALERLRREIALWPRLRWVNLALGLLLPVFGFTAAFQKISALAAFLSAGQPIRAPEVFLASETAFWVSMMALAGILGVILAVRTANDWRGDPSKILLVSLFLAESKTNRSEDTSEPKSAA